MKRKLLFAIVALLCSVATWARTDVTSTYLTDAELANESSNWALVSNGGNHKWDSNNKYHESWHNTFTLTQTTGPLTAGYYQLSIQAAVEGGTSTTISLQATSSGNTSVAAYPKYSTAGSYSDMAAWWAADATGTGNRNLNRIFTTVYVEEGQTLTATFKQTANNQWFVYGQMQLHKLTDEEGRNAQILEAVYNPMTNLDMASGRFKQRFESYDAAAVSSGKRLNKTISGLPKGKYNVTLNGGASYTSGRGFDGNTGDNLTDFFANDATTNVTVYDRGNIGNSEFVDYTASGALVTNGNLEVGYNNKATGANWFVGSVKYIELAEPYISCIAEEIPAATETVLTANKWYKFTAASSDDHAFEAGTISNIIYTTIDQLLSTVTETTTATALIALTEGTTYYIKSTSSQALTITPQTFTYTVGSAAADKSYIQPGNTVTVSYADLGTDNPSPTLVKDFSGVTFNGSAVSCTSTANGFTFTVPTVAAATDYTLAIPAGAIGYAEGSTYNEAQNITLTTPAIYDGVYFLKVAATYNGTSEGTSAAVGKYLARGLNYGTHATLDKYGLPLQISTDANNATSIQAFDTKRYFFHGNTYDCWADQASLAESGKFTVTLNNGKYMLHNNSMAAGTYLKYNTSAAGDANIAVYDDGDGTNNGPIIMWTTEDASTHASVMQGYKDTQAAAAAAVAYASGNYASLDGITTVSALEAELTANYIEGVFVAPSPIESISEKYQGGQPGAGNVTETVYSNTINITQPGFYKFSMQAFYRAGSNDVTQAMHTAGIDFPPVVLFFGDSEAQIKSIYDEGGLDQGVADGYFETETVGGAPVQYNSKWYTNGQHNSVIIFQKDYYHNDVWFYASEPGEYSYGVKYMGWACANMQWFIYSPESVTITSYAAAADDDDYTALTSAINAYDNATWGFENGEYAPYNNAEAIANIAAARAINSSETNSKLLVNSLTAKLALTVNATDVDAIYNGLFATVAAGQNYPDGWTRTNDWGQMQSGISGDFATAYYNHPGSLQYGNQGVYTMPLAANQEYKLTFSYRSQEDNSNTGMTVSVLNSSDGLGETAFEGNGSNSAWKTASAYFTTGAAGNYVLTLGNGGNTWITNVSLVKVASTELELSEEDAYTPEFAYYETVSLARNIAAGTWSTFVVPFDIDNATMADQFGADVQVSEFSADDKTGLKFTPMAEPAITANTPVLVKTSSNNDSFTFSGVTIKEGTPTISQNGVNFVGNYGGDIAIPNTLDTYFVKSNTIKKSTGAQKLKGFRAYFTVDADSPVKAFFENDIFIDDEATGIVNLNDNLNKNEAIYNLAGQRVQKAQKGLYIVNGRKVVVK